MRRFWVVKACGRPVHDVWLSFEEAQLLWDVWILMCDDAIIEEVIVDVVQ